MSDLVGRDVELSTGRAAMAALARGQGRLVVISGEPGIGKTRLAEELVAEARTAGAQTTWGSVWPELGAPPMWPWPDVVGQLDALGPSPAAHAGAPEDGPTSDGDRFARFRSVIDRLRQATATRPAVVVIDDAHDAGPDTLALTKMVARSLHTMPLVLIVTHRDTPDTSPEAIAALADLHREGVVLRLRRLEPHEVVEFAENWASARHRELSPADTDRLIGLTGGLPLLLHEMVASFDAGTTDAVRRVAHNELAVRMTNMDPADRGLLRVAAALGPGATAAEVLAVARVDGDHLARARAAGLSTGILAEGPDHFTFTHELGRDALVGELAGGQLADLYRTASDLLGTGDHAGPATAVRRARYALTAVESGTLDPTSIAGIVAAAGHTLSSGFAYDEAAAMFGRAQRVLETLGVSPPSGLLLRRAQATLSAGRLSDARPLFRSAIEAALKNDDAATAARAALGLGGVWVHELRTPPEEDDYLRLLGDLEERTADHRVLQARLRMRLAAELHYRSLGPLEDVRAAFARVHATGDDAARAESASLLHHVLLGPRHGGERAALADSIIALATAAGDGLGAVMGVLWRTVDLFLAGDPRAEGSLVELRARTDAVAVQSACLVVDEIEVMRHIRAGRFGEAEALADTCLALGLAVGDADAFAWYSGQILALRWYQGREIELLDAARELAGNSSVPASIRLYPAVAATITARSGQVDEARRWLAQVRGRHLGELASSSMWMITMAAVIDAAAHLGDVDLAAEAYDLLRPYAHLPIMGSIAVCCLGSTEWALGVAAATAGDLDAACTHLEAARYANRELGNRPMRAISTAEEAFVRLRRGGPADHDRAVALLDEAIELGTGLELDLRLATWVERRRSLTTSADVRRGSFRRRAHTWELQANGLTAVIPDSFGAGYLATLLTCPGREVAADQLAGGGTAERDQPVLDATTRASYRRRITELRGEIDRADQGGDTEGASRLRLEYDAVLSEIERNVRPDGRSRAFTGGGERARTSVQKALRRAIAAVAAESPGLGEALALSIATGRYCSFDPANGLPEQWDVHTAIATPAELSS